MRRALSALRTGAAAIGRALGTFQLAPPATPRAFRRPLPDAEAAAADAAAIAGDLRRAIAAVAGAGQQLRLRCAACGTRAAAVFVERLQQAPVPLCSACYRVRLPAPRRQDFKPGPPAAAVAVARAGAPLTQQQRLGQPVAAVVERDANGADGAPAAAAGARLELPARGTPRPIAQASPSHDGSVDAATCERCERVDVAAPGELCRACDAELRAEQQRVDEHRARRQERRR